MRRTQKEGERMKVDFDLNEASAEELKAEMVKAIKSAPLVIEDEMKKERAMFKSAMIKETWSAVGRKTGNITKGFHFDKLEKIGVEYLTNFFAENKKNPHFHLINNGHELVKNGKVIGFVPGRRIKEPVIKKFESEHYERSKRALERICDKIK